MDAFDSDVLIYAAMTGHPLGRRVRALFQPHGAEDAEVVGIGSVLLLPEVLTKPIRDGNDDEVRELAVLLGRLELLPADEATAELAASLGARCGLRAGDAVHLATAVAAGADRFITNNRKDFRKTIEEIDVVYADEL